MDDLIVFDFCDEMFFEFNWEDTPYGYHVDMHSTPLLGAFPDDLIYPGNTCFLVNNESKGLPAYYLGGYINEDKKEALIFGLPHPEAVFTCEKSELQALHTVAGNFVRDEILLHQFAGEGLTNNVASLPVNRDWRPWHSQLH